MKDFTGLEDILSKYKEDKDLLRQTEQDAKLMDFSIPLFAAGTIKYPIELKTKDNKYSIFITENLEQSNRGAIALEVLDEDTRKAIEGQKIIVKDGNNRTLLKGTVRQNKVGAEIFDLKDIDLSAITVLPDFKT